MSPHLVNLVFYVYIVTINMYLAYTLYRQKYCDTPFFRTEKCTSKTVATKMKT